MEEAIDVGSETSSDPMVFRSSTRPGSRLRTRVAHRRVKSSSRIETMSEGVGQLLDVVLVSCVTSELLEDVRSVYVLGARTHLVVLGPSYRTNRPGGGWSTLWLEALRYKVHFPLPGLIVGLCCHFNLALSQLKPHV